MMLAYSLYFVQTKLSAMRVLVTSLQLLFRWDPSHVCFLRWDPSLLSQMGSTPSASSDGINPARQINSHFEQLLTVYDVSCVATSSQDGREPNR